VRGLPPLEPGFSPERRLLTVDVLVGCRRIRVALGNNTLEALGSGPIAGEADQVQALERCRERILALMMRLMRRR
jgi:hypothetical protein